MSVWANSSVTLCGQTAALFCVGKQQRYFVWANSSVTLCGQTAALLCLVVHIIIIIIIIIIILAAIELSLGGSSPYTSTVKTIENKYT